MINNRQGGRRRGRGGQRPQGIGGRSDGNRQDNRQRGNAAQLLEKYKSMARDSQLSGDRVQTEYYLQFAEHYFRVLGESRARFDEQRRARGEDFDDGDDDDTDLIEADGDAGESDEVDFQDRSQRREQPRRPVDDRGERPQRQRAFEREDRPQRQPERQTERQPERQPERSNGRPPRREEAEVEQRIPFDVIPPAIGGPDTDPIEGADLAPRPRRRIRRQPTEGGPDIAPAA